MGMQTSSVQNHAVRLSKQHTARIWNGMAGICYLQEMYTYFCSSLYLSMSIHLCVCIFIYEDIDICWVFFKKTMLSLK